MAKGPKVKVEDSELDPWVFACTDWEKRLKAGQMPADLGKVLPLLNRDRADRALAVFNRLKLSDVPGQPVLADACGQWFKTIVQVLSGGIDKDGIQHVRDIFLMIAKKNAKTSLGGLTMLTMMLMSPRPRAEFVIVAPTIQIASIAFSQIAGAIYCDEMLRDRMHVKEHIRTIEDRKSSCTLSVKSFSMEVATGSKCAGLLVDEVWLMQHPDASRVIGQLKGGMAAIPEAFTLMTTTQSDGPPRGFFASELGKARAIRDGSSDLSGYWPILFEPTRDLASSMQGLMSVEAWRMANPNLGLSVSVDWLKASAKEAIATSKDETQRWLSQHVNAEVTAYAGAEDMWPGAQVWDDAADDMVTLDSIRMMADRIVLGIDGGGGDDLLSICVLGLMPDGAWHLWSQNWCWDVALERRKSIASLLEDFANDGHLSIVRAGDDIEEVVSFISEISETGKLVSVGLDPAGVAGELSRAIADREPHLQKNLINVPQGWRLRSGWNALERKLRSGGLRHGGQHVMSWSVKNTKQDPVSGMVTKKLSGAGKIDPVVACAIAAIVALEAPPPFDVAALIG